MIKNYLTGKITIAFKPEAEQSAIETILNQYEFKKVFNKGEVGHSTDRVDKVLDRLYSLTVAPGTEAAVVEGLKIKYSRFIEYVELPAQRGIKR